MNTNTFREELVEHIEMSGEDCDSVYCPTVIEDITLRANSYAMSDPATDASYAPTDCIGCYRRVTAYSE